MEDGSITEIKVDEDAKSITLKLENVREGKFLISLPSGLISAFNDNFVILLPGLPPLQYEVVDSSSGHTTLQIDLPEETSEVTIVGTNVVPEFGMITMAILVVSILAIVTLTRTSRLVLKL
jgi:predicted secreted protein with PEFG-CTERM motif